MSGPGFYVNNTYILHEVLGSGGMGTVYRATHRLSGQVVALKRVELAVPEEAHGRGAKARPAPAPGAAGPILRAALAHEFRLLASLHHPHIVRVIDYGFDEEHAPFYTMELIDSPRTILEAAGELTALAKIDLLTQLLRALAYLHRRNILHRDIKPSNVTIERET